MPRDGERESVVVAGQCVCVWDGVSEREKCHEQFNPASESTQAVASTSHRHNHGAAKATAEKPMSKSAVENGHEKQKKGCWRSNTTAVQKRGGNSNNDDNEKAERREVNGVAHAGRLTTARDPFCSVIRL